MKKLLVIVLIMCIAQLQAQERIGKTEALMTAERFIKQQGKFNVRALTLNEEIKSKQSGQTNLFVFSVVPQGFVVVSALGDILAYSPFSEMPSINTLPDHISYWLDLYNEATDRLIMHPEQRKEPTRSQTAVEPLLTSCWGQGCYHNAACPHDQQGPCQHVSAGCVAIAMAQVMYFHKQPVMGKGSATYYCSPYGTLSANFGQTVYRWEDMADTLHESNSAVAELISHCGIAVKMQYGAHLSLASNQKTIAALHQNFVYPHAKLLQRSNLTDEEWLNLIANDLDLGRPVYYAGTSDLGGHAFVCDGYDNNRMFHFNFGWDGVADGYYTLNDPYGFSNRQAAIHNIYPANNIPINYDEHGIIYVSQDGTGDGSSWANATSKLQLAIFKSMVDSACIWVSQGTYYGAAYDNYAFTLVDGCRMYGGFKGDEPFNYDLSLRDFEAHPSILDGNQSQGVVEATATFDNTPIIIDGFTLQNGNASLGGGIFINGSAMVSNCLITNNNATSGGGIMQRSDSLISVVIEHCEISNNSASKGGGVYDWGNATYQYCQIHHNTAMQKGGGVMCNNSNNNAQSVFVGCTVCNNTARAGGGLYSDTSKATFWSCIFNNNTAQTGGGCELSKNAKLYNCTIVKNEAEVNYGGVLNNQPDGQNGIMNCIIWGNVSQGENAQIWPYDSYSHCAVENDASEQESNFKAEAQNDGNLPSFYVRFHNPGDVAGNTGQGGDWRLLPNSLCINRGITIADQPSTDMDGNPRCQHDKIDLGAYESNTATQFIDAYLCEDGPYYFQDSLIAESGFYTFLHHGNPFDTLVIIHMQLPPPTVFYKEEICENETFDFFGTMLNEPGQYSTTINCITYELDLSIKPLDLVNMQEEICENETYDFFGTPLNEAGTYYDTLDCIVYKLDLDIKPSSFYHMEKTICEGETYDFLGRTLNQSGHYFKAIDCQHHELDLTVNPKPMLRCSNDTLVEYGNPIYLYASGADSYLWSTGETTESILIYPFTDRAYTVTGFLQDGCSNTASIMVKIINEADEMVLYPNPAGSRTTIYKPLIDEVEVFDLLGVRMDHIDTNRQLVELDVSHYTNGVYIVHIRCLNNHYFQKLVVRH